MEMDGKFLTEEQIGKTGSPSKARNSPSTPARTATRGSTRSTPAMDPKHLDILITRGDEKGKTYLVAYKFEKGQMVQVMEVSNAQRPTEFTGKKGSGNLLEFWERVE